MTVKECRSCRRQLALTEFYEHQLMADGHLSRCKDRVRARVRKRYAEVRNVIRAYEAERQRRPERRAAKLDYQRRARARDPLRYKARTAVGNAIRDGRLVRQPCEVCGERAEAHHEDYARPLDVRWLCFRHHRAHEHGQHVGG